MQKDILRVAIHEAGGLGDSLFQLTYIKEIRKLFDRPVVIDYYCRAHKAFQNFPFIDNCWPLPITHPVDDYDVYIKSRRFYMMLKMDEDKLKNYPGPFYEFCKYSQKLSDKILGREYSNSLYNHYSLMYGKNRLEQPDVKGILPVDRNTPKFMAWDENSFEVLNKNNLTDAVYIILNRAADRHAPENHPKLWPLKYYDDLIALIKQKYPKIKIAQIGAGNKFGVMKGVDLNLLGKTTFDEMKVLLKYSLCHIDGESGLVHMRNFLNGKSIAIFGPTSIETFGYKENINLRGNACAGACDWLTGNWSSGCMRGFKNAPCMESLAPQMVFEHFCKFVDNTAKHQFTCSNPSAREIDGMLKPGGQLSVAQIIRDEGEFLNKAAAAKHNVWLYAEDLSAPDKEYKNNCRCHGEFAKKGIFAEYATRYNIPAADDSFDIVYTSRLAAAARPELMLKEMLRVSKDDGKLLIACPREQKENISATIADALKTAPPALNPGGVLAITKHRLN